MCLVIWFLVSYVVLSFPEFVGDEFWFVVDLLGFLANTFVGLLR